VKTLTRLADDGSVLAMIDKGRLYMICWM